MLMRIADLDREMREKALSLPDRALRAGRPLGARHAPGRQLLRACSRAAIRECPTAAAVRAWPAAAQDAHRATRRASTRRSIGLLLQKDQLLRARAPRPAHKAVLDLWLYFHVPLAFMLLAALDRARRRRSSSTGRRRREDPRSSCKSPARAPPVRRGRSAATGCASGATPSCEIHLPIRASPSTRAWSSIATGFVYIEGEAGSQNITRKTRALGATEARRIRSTSDRTGSRHSAAPAGYDGALQVELVRPLEVAAELASRTAQPHARLPRLHQARAAWALGARDAGPLPRCSRPDACSTCRGATRAMQSAFGDRFWNPGPLILAHQPIETRCAACHEVAFEHVKDRACLRVPHRRSATTCGAGDEARGRSSTARAARPATATTRA